MDKFQFWLMLVQTTALAEQHATSNPHQMLVPAIKALADASTVDPRCLMSNPLDMSTQAIEFVYWKVRGGHTPEWIVWQKKEFESEIERDGLLSEVKRLKAENQYLKEQVEREKSLPYRVLATMLGINREGGKKIPPPPPPPKPKR